MEMYEQFLTFLSSHSELSWEIYLICAGCWFLGGIANGAIGFGMTTTAVPLMSLAMPIRFMPPFIAIMASGGFGKLAWEYRDQINWKQIAPLLIGILPGAWLGLTFALNLPEPPVRIFLGLFVICFAVWKIFFKGAVRGKIHPYWGLPLGVFASGLSSVFGMAGPPIAVYGLLCGWPKDSFKAAMGAFFIVAKIVIIALQIMKGLYSWTVIFAIATSLPALFLGMKVGFKISDYINQELFEKILHWFLLFVGCNIVVRMTLKLMAA